MSDPCTIVFNEGMFELVSSGTFRRRFNARGDGTVSIIIGDPELVSFGSARELMMCSSLLHVDLSGCVNVRSIPALCFAGCTYLQKIILPLGLKSVGACAFRDTSLFTLVLHQGLESLGAKSFGNCTALTSVILPESLNSVEKYMFWGCSKLEKVSISSSSVSFDEYTFVGCSRMIELATAAGFPSKTTVTDPRDGSRRNRGAGVSQYVMELFARKTKKDIVLAAYMRFNHIVHTTLGKEKEKVAVAKASYEVVGESEEILVGAFFVSCNKGGGIKGVLGYILKYL